MRGIGPWALLCVALATSARAAPSALCPGTCEQGETPCGADADCEAGPCVFDAACLPGHPELVGLIASIVPEGPRGLNDHDAGWACGLVACAPADDHLAYASSYGISAVATKDIALAPGRYLVLAEMAADPDTWGYFDIAATAPLARSDDALGDWRLVSAFLEVPDDHRGPLQFRLHADGPGQVRMRRVAILGLRDYGVYLRMRVASPEAPFAVRATHLLRHVEDSLGARPELCPEDATPASPCVPRALVEARAEAGAWTPWLEVSAIASGGWRMTTAWAIEACGDTCTPMSGAVTLELELAHAPDEAAVVARATRSLTSPRLGLVLPEGVPHPFELGLDFVDDLVARDLALLDEPPARPTRFRLGTPTHPVVPFASSSLQLPLLELLAALGLNVRGALSTPPTADELARAAALDLDARWLELDPLLDALAPGPLDYDPEAFATAARAALAEPPWVGAAAGLEDAPERVFAVVRRPDGLALAGPLYRAAFAAWLAERGERPEDLGLASLEDAVPLEGALLDLARPDPSDPQAARRFVRALEFRAIAQARLLAALRDEVNAALGDVHLAHLGPSPLEHGSLDLDFQHLAREQAVTASFGAATPHGLDDCAAWRFGLFADLAVGRASPWREAAAARGSELPLALSLAADRGDLGKRLLELAARGFSWFEIDAYGPYDLAPEGGAGGLGERSAPWLERVRAASATLTAAEPFLAGAQRAVAPVAILASQSDAPWTDLSGLTEDEIGWHLALTHAHIPVDFMLEDEIAQGLLDHPITPRRALFVFRKHVSARAWSAIERWVEGGGLLVLGPELASHDELGRLDIDRAAWLALAPGNTVSGSQTILWAGPQGVASFLYQGELHELVALAGTPLAVFDDDRPVVMRLPRGRGRVIALGLDLGAAYRAVEAGCDASGPSSLPRHPTGYSPVMRDVMSSLLAFAGVSAGVRADQPLVALHRLTSPDGRPFVLAIPWTDGSEPVAITIPEAADCASVREELEGYDVPVTFGSIYTTLDGPALYTWSPTCEPTPADEPERAEAEPEPAPRGDDGCATGGLGGALAMLAFALLRSRSSTRSA